MTTAQATTEHLKTLPESVQQEVLDLAKSLESQRAELAQREENIAWSHSSLAAALRGMEHEEPACMLADLKEPSS